MLFKKIDYFCIDNGFGVTTRVIDVKPEDQIDDTTWAYLNIRSVILTGRSYCQQTIDGDAVETYPYDIVNTIQTICGGLVSDRLTEERIYEIANRCKKRKYQLDKSGCKFDAPLVKALTRPETIMMLKYGLSGLKRLYTIQYNESEGGIRELLQKKVLLSEQTPISVIKIITNTLSVPSSILNVTEATYNKRLKKPVNLDTVGKCLLFGNYYQQYWTSVPDKKAFEKLKVALENCLTYFNPTNIRWSYNTTIDGIWSWLKPYDETIDIVEAFNTGSVFLFNNKLASPIDAELLGDPRDRHLGTMFPSSMESSIMCPWGRFGRLIRSGMDEM